MVSDLLTLVSTNGRKRVKVLLAAVNAKYIHSNLAVYCLRAYAKERYPESEIAIAEYTINQPFDEILTDL